MQSEDNVLADRDITEKWTVPVPNWTRLVLMVSVLRGQIFYLFMNTTS